MRRPTLLFLAVLLTALSVSCAEADPPASDGNDAAEALETPAPEGKDRNSGGKKTEPPPPEWDGPNFVVTTFEGERFELAAQAGHPVVLNFWESW